MVLLPEGGELTLAELRDVAARQQQQIEAQQQLLVAKEQRLKFLKQQEARHHQGSRAAEVEILHQLRETVEAQELKIRRLRALQGQVEQQQGSNSNLGGELESIRALFSEKEKELSLAVVKVEELARQLEDLRRTSRLHAVASAPSSAAVAELEKLRQELMYRTKLTEQQNACIVKQRDLLAQRQQEISHMDQKILELQHRLQRKCLLNQQLATQLHAVTNVRQLHHHPTAGKARHRPLSTNIATVEPLQRTPKEPERTQDDLHAKLQRTSEAEDLAEFTPSKNDPKYQTLPYNTKFLIKGAKEQEGDHDTDGEEEQPPATENEPPAVVPPAASFPTAPFPTAQHTLFPTTTQSHSPLMSPCKPSHNLTNFTPRPFGTTYSSSLLGPLTASLAPSRGQQSPGNNSPVGIVRAAPSSLSPVPSAPAPCPSSSPLEVHSTPRTAQAQLRLGSPPVQEPEKNELEAITPFQSGDFKVHQQPHFTPPSTKFTETKGDTQKPSFSGPEESQPNCKPALPPKPLIPSKPVPPPRQIHGAGSSQDKNEVNLALSVLRSSGSERDRAHYSHYRERLLYYNYVQRFHTKPSSISSQLASTRVAGANNHSLDTSCHDSTASSEDNETVKRRQSPVQLPIRPKPLTIRKSPGLEPPRLKANQLSASEALKSKGSSLVSYKRPLESGSSHLHAANSNNARRIEIPPVFLQREETPAEANSNAETKEKQDVTDKAAEETEGKQTAHLEKQRPFTEDQLDEFNGNVSQKDNIVQATEAKTDGESSEPLSSPQLPGSEKDDSDTVGSYPTSGHQSAALRRVKKGNLKTPESSKNPRRVSFDPLALLLDAALEGELELVIKTTCEVPNPSAANDEGITALHNAICAGHFEIVTFLVEFGCDVNAQDSDGWTPLHCAASCNNLPMVKFLAEHGACIFATTLSDHETAAEKCEEDEEGFDGCSEYLYGIQEKLGILNNGTVYAVYDYEAQNADELSFKDGCTMNVLRKGDDQEREWWWAQISDREGYIPRNLLGLNPRVTPKKEG